MAEVLSLFDQARPSSITSTAWKGRVGEALAATFLERKGYRLVAANFKVPVGLIVREHK